MYLCGKGEAFQERAPGGRSPFWGQQNVFREPHGVPCHENPRGRAGGQEVLLGRKPGMRSELRKCQKFPLIFLWNSGQKPLSAIREFFKKSGVVFSSRIFSAEAIPAEKGRTMLRGMLFMHLYNTPFLAILSFTAFRI